MNYTQVCISIEKQELREIVIALLENIGYEGFEEEADRIKAYIPEEQYDEEQVKGMLAKFNLQYSSRSIAQQNWNAEWESNFQPVVVKDFCTVRAGFHKISVDTPYEIIITPKMSFGTGHHATTQLMMMQMAKIPFENKTVLDFGTGTGILAILAEKLGSSTVLAIDNDEWSFENVKENIAANSCFKVNAGIGSLETADNQYDVILANINRHILLQYMGDIYYKVKAKGTVLMSGIIKEDREMIISAAESAGFQLLAEDELNNWIILVFNK